MNDEGRFKSYYSRIVLRGNDSEGVFFSATRGQFDTKGDRLRTYVDTNIDIANTFAHKNFKIKEIRFYVSKSEVKFRKHLVDNGFFIFRIADMDVCICPIHMMIETPSYYKKVFDGVIDIHAYESFITYLRMDKEFGKDVRVTCELLGTENAGI